MANRKDLETKKDLARLYYMQGEIQEVIADKVGVSRNTISRWAEQGGWSTKRAAVSITRPEIVTKTLSLIGRLIDKLNSETDLERIDKKANVVDAIETFTALNKWLESRMEWDEELTPEFMRTLARYQDLFISEQVKK